MMNVSKFVACLMLANSIYVYSFDITDAQLHFKAGHLSKSEPIVYRKGRIAEEDTLGVIKKKAVVNKPKESYLTQLFTRPDVQEVSTKPAECLDTLIAQDNLSQFAKIICDYKYAKLSEAAAKMALIIDMQDKKVWSDPDSLIGVIIKRRKDTDLRVAEIAYKNTFKLLLQMPQANNEIQCCPIVRHTDIGKGARCVCTSHGLLSEALRDEPLTVYVKNNSCESCIDHSFNGPCCCTYANIRKAYEHSPFNYVAELIRNRVEELHAVSRRSVSAPDIGDHLRSQVPTPPYIPIRQRSQVKHRVVSVTYTEMVPKPVHNTPEEDDIFSLEE